MSNNPIALYRNLLAEAGTIPEDGAQLIDDDTTQRWLPQDADALVFENLPGVQVTHIGVAAHNLGTEGGSFLIETGDGVTWTTLTTLTATDDQAFLVPVGPVAVQNLRITAQGDDLQLGILYVGEALEFERRLYQGHTPIVFGDGNTLIVKDQRGGQYVGNQVRRRARSTKVSINNLTPQFIRQRLEPFRQHYNDGGRFFFSWRPQKYASDAVYAKGTGGMSPTNSGPAALMSVDFDVMAYVQTYRPEYILPPAPPEPGPEPDPNDPDWDSVISLLHFDNTLDDEKGRVWTPSGSVSATETGGKFGGKLSLDGGYITTAYTTDFDWFASDYTIECWLNPTNLSSFERSGNCTLLGRMTPNSGLADWSFGPLSDGQVRFIYWNGSMQVIAIGPTISTGAWTHIAAVVSSGQIKVFVNGVGGASVAITGTPSASPGVNITMGRYNGTSASGGVDDFRITKGVARYSANFTPPAAPFPDQGP